MRGLVSVGFAFLLLILQSLGIHLGVPAWLMPQGLLVCVVFLAFYECSVRAACAAFCIGLLLDMSGAVLIGPWAGAYVLVYLCVSFLSQRLFVESRVVAMCVVAGATVLASGVFLVLSSTRDVSWSEFGFMALGQAVASAAVTPFIFAALRRVGQRSGVTSMTRGSVVSAV
jgi:rod shape-determining protein MreD